MNYRLRAFVLFFIFGAASLGNPVLANIGTPTAPRTTGIQLVGLTPTDMSVDVPANTSLTVEFGGDLSPAFYQSVSMNLFHGGRPIEGELFYNPSSRQVMFKPKLALPLGQTLTAQLSYADAAGATSEKIWSFRVKGNSLPASSLAANPSSPQLLSAQGGTEQTAPVAKKLSISSANMASGVIPQGSSLEITFSEPLELSSLKDGPVKLFAGKKPVGVDYKLSRDLKTLTLIPRNLLKPGENFNVAISQQILGTSGAQFPKNTLIPFKVGGGGEFETAQGTAVPDHVIEETPAETPRPAASPVFNPFETGREGFQTAAPIQPFKVVALSPRNGESISNLNQPVTVAFNAEAKPETLNEFTFKLEDEFGPVPAKIRYYTGKKIAVLTPIGVLDSQKSYRVVLSNGITDNMGQALSNSISTSFATIGPKKEVMERAMVDQSLAPREFSSMPQKRNDSSYPGNMIPRQTAPQKSKRPPAAMTAAIPESDPTSDSKELEVVDDETPLFEDKAPRQETSRGQAPARRSPPKKERLSSFKVTGIQPAANSEQVGRQTRIVVQFSEAANPSSINGINLSVFGNQRRVEGRVSYDSRTRRAVFLPGETLRPETQYRVVMNDKIKSASGEPILGKYTWQFTTEGERKGNYSPLVSAEADAAFSIPLVDRKSTHRVVPKTTSEGMTSGTGFAYIPASHWVFKTIRNISQKGMLSANPFANKNKVSRTECAMVVNNALLNLRSMQTSKTKAKLRVSDLVELEKLVIEFKPELRSFGSEPVWFERFLQEQGVKVSEVENQVNSMNRG